MSEPKVPLMPKWPFLIADVAAWIGCYLIYQMGSGPFELGQTVAFIVCGLLGAFFLCYPFAREYQLDARIAEADQLAQVTDFMTRLEKVKNGVTVATAHLETAQDYSEKTIESSKEIAERMTDEAKAFAEFMAKANDTEKAHLELELEKLKRGESEWIKALITTLDETFRICQAAAQSGNAGVAEQLAKFQSVCRAAAGRIGLVPFEPDFGDPFDSEKHVLVDSKGAAPEGARVGGTLAPGYTYMRRPLRPAAVALQGVGAAAPEPVPPPAVASAPDVAEPAVAEPEAGEEGAPEAEEDFQVTDDLDALTEDAPSDVEDAPSDVEDADADAEPDFDESDEEVSDEAGAEKLDDEALAEDPFTEEEEVERGDDDFEVEDQDDGSDMASDGEDAGFIAQQLRQMENEAAASDEGDEDEASGSEQRELL
jgi:hypothetical protein